MLLENAKIEKEINKERKCYDVLLSYAKTKLPDQEEDPTAGKRPRKEGKGEDPFAAVDLWKEEMKKGEEELHSLASQLEKLETELSDTIAAIATRMKEREKV